MLSTVTTSSTPEEIAYSQGERKGREDMAKELAGKMIEGILLLLFALICINILPYFLF